MRGGKRKSEEIDDARAENIGRIQNLFTRAIALSEKALERAERLQQDGEELACRKCGDPVLVCSNCSAPFRTEMTLETLMKIHADFTVWGAKFSASEAPKRIEVGGRVDHVQVMDGATIDRLERFMAEHEKLLPAITVPTTHEHPRANQ